jgi:hypothetical protein
MYFLIIILFIYNINFTNYYYSAERQSVASADRMQEGRQGKRPDFMHIIKLDGKIFELVFGECSRVICNDNKKHEDEIKLWREANDGMYWVRKLRKPEKEQFTIIGIQVAGNVFYYLV